MTFKNIPKECPTAKLKDGRLNNQGLVVVAQGTQVHESTLVAKYRDFYGI